jgi:hypothetical protein
MASILASDNEDCIRISLQNKFQKQGHVFLSLSPFSFSHLNETDTDTDETIHIIYVDCRIYNTDTPLLVSYFPILRFKMESVKI